MDLIDYLQAKLKKQKGGHEFVPYFEGFRGTVQKVDSHKYMTKGLYEKIDTDKIRITELPIGTWTMPYISFLEGLADGTTDKQGKKIPPSIRDFTSLSTEVSIDISVTFPRGKLAELEEKRDEHGVNGVEKMLKMTSSVSSTNMHMFNHECKLRKYAGVEDIIDEFYDVRLETYSKRKKYLLENLRRHLVKLSNRAKYILGNLDGTIDLRRKSSSAVHDLLVGAGFALIDGDFKYLVKMPMDSVTQENVEKILKEKDDAEKELALLEKTTLEAMWLSELGDLRTAYLQYKSVRESIQKGDVQKKVVKKKMVKKVKK